MYIPLDHDSPVTLTRQISGYLEELIRRGLVGPEGRLPATRTLASDLGVNKKTVEAAYDELAARGLVHIRPGRGVEVASEIPEGPELELGLPEPRHRDPLPRSAWIEPEGRPERILDLAGAGARLTNLSSRVLRGLHDRALADRRAPLFTPPPPLGEAALRAAAARHLARGGVLLDADEVAVVPGRTAGLRWLLDQFVPYRGAVLVDGLLDPELMQPLRERQVRVVFLPEGRGMSAGAWSGPAHLMVVGTGAARLPGGPPGLSRRRALLDLARDCGVPIVEDVSNAEWIEEAGHPPALSVLDRTGRVFPLSDLSDEIGGWYHAAAVGGTAKIVDRLRHAPDPGDRPLDRLAQRALAGALDAAARTRTRRALRERRELLKPALSRGIRRRLAECPGHEYSAGADAVRIDLPEGVRGETLQLLASQLGVLINSGTDCGAGAASDTFVLLDLTRVEEGDLLEGIRLLGQALDLELEELEESAD